MNALDGKTVLITGASRGIGAEIVRTLAAEAVTLVGVARSQNRLADICAEVEAKGGNFVGIASDLSQMQTLPWLVHNVRQQVGKVDILINNAAVEKYAAFSQYTSGDIHSILSTNLLAAMELSRLLLPEMLRQGQGHIVNIASLAGKKGAPYNSLYSASKGGLILWADALRQELASTPINVSVICPGYVSQSGMTVDTQVPIPALAGQSTPTRVAAAVVRAIAQNKAGIIVNQNLITEQLTKLLLAVGQVAPRLSDGLYRQIGITRLNEMRTYQLAAKKTLSHCLPTLEDS